MSDTLANHHDTLGAIDSPVEKKQDVVSSEKTELEKKAIWLCEAVQSGLDHARKRKNQFKRKASIIKISTVLLSGFVTILLGIQLKGFEDHFKMLAFVLDALVTIGNALEPFFNFRSLWVEHEEAAYRLYRL